MADIAPREPTLADPKLSDPEDPNLSAHRLRAVEALRLCADGVLRLIDCRRAAPRAEAGRRVAATAWVDPANVSAPALRAEDPRPIAFYCVHGHGVSQTACETVRSDGGLAYFVQGGYDALVAAGAEIEAIDPTSEGGGA